MAMVETRMLVLLAPVYPDVCTTSGSTSVELQRTADDWLQLAFSTPNGIVTKEAACINNHDGCRCDYVRLLRSLMVLSEREALSITGTYLVAKTETKAHAVLKMKVKVHRNATIGESLKDFQLILSHLQMEGLSIARHSEKSRKEAWKTALLDATCSSCHVVGCRLHSWEADEILGPKAKLHLPDVFQSLMTHMEAEQQEIRDDITLVPRVEEKPGKPLQLTNLPTHTLHLVVCMLEANELVNWSGVCSLFHHLAYEVVPGLNLVLYEHQRKGLKWMLHRETPSLINQSLLHPFVFARRPGRKIKVGIDLTDMKAVEHVDTTTKDTCGGMFCDEPGLGKTITMLALILRTKGQATRNAQTRLEMRAEGALDTYLRPRGHTVQEEDLVSSGASLIVVPDPLVEHWKYQIEAHVADGALRAYIDQGNQNLPLNVELATYDVVVTSFSRLAKEWKLHRPASSLEKRMPERYGFEGPQRYADGTVRGEVSSLLTVLWVRVIVDEGHKLGGQTPTNLMRMARLLSAERRWVMTGTPTPNTLQSADLRFMHGLLVFLRNKPYGQTDGRAWIKAIARPFEQNQPIGFYRLQSLLSRIMMRHTKESIKDILPEPIRHTVYIDPTPSEYAQYNVVAAAVRANLVITNLDPRVPGKLHLDSLLNPINRKEALRVVSNLRLACCGGVKSEVVLSDKALLETINMLVELGVNLGNIATVSVYLRRVTLPGMTTTCGCCQRKLQLLMIIPCGHLCCADCIEDRYTEVGPSCFFCKEVYDPEVFQELQPGFDFREVDDGDKENSTMKTRGQQKSPGGQVVQGSSRSQAPNRHYWTVDASKIFYAAARIRELKKEFAHRSACLGANPPKKARYVKVIIFSQFSEIIWRTKLAFEQQKIPTANFITRVAPKARMRALKRFREDPSLNVLLLSEMGSHGLDLSFVTHVFLMEQIWDKSLEQQVISRAHRMGAQQEVVVEQLWMRGSVESEMANVDKLGDNEVDPPRIIHDLGPPARTRKRKRNGKNALLNVAGKKKRKRNRQGDAKKIPTGNKSSLLQRKLDYVLKHLRLLRSDLAAPSGQVRFSVVDERDGTKIRQATHVTRSAAAKTSLQPVPEAKRAASNHQHAVAGQHEQSKQYRQTVLPVVVAKTPARAVPARKTGAAQAKTTMPAQKTGTAQAKTTANTSVVAAQPTQSKNVVATTKMVSGMCRVCSQETVSAATSSSAKEMQPENIIVIEKDPAALPPQVTSHTPALTGGTSAYDAIKIDCSSSDSEKNSLDGSESDSDISMASSSSSCSADNEEHFGSDDSEDDSDESDEESKALFSRLVQVASRHFAKIREPADQSNPARATNTPSTSVAIKQEVVPVPPLPEIDDEETETE